ncbi:hypothetical protein [uncultured Arcobacter sp.]|uniref:hypothetical protein n=1 Tax=uncultured Arcobacter sp. TaxID=165434 RepID=UPI00261AF8C9|nr:hypothetical protein [uncultured Arcobacter sp.]
MIQKQIDKRIYYKVQSWIKSIEDKTLRTRILDNIVVSGGCITSMLLDEEVNDYDIYFKDINVLIDVANYYCNYAITKSSARNKFRDHTNNYGDKNDLRVMIYDSENDKDIKWSVDNDYDEGVHMFYGCNYHELSDFDLPLQYTAEPFKDVRYQVKCFTPSSGITKVKYNKNMTDKPYKPVCITDNAISLENDIQLILRFYGNPEIIISNYDYQHTKMYWTYSTGVVINIESLKCVLNKELKYTGSKFPIASLFRMRKFIKRGWFINVGEILKMVYQIDRLDLYDIKTMYEQLVGVDVLYMKPFIDAMMEYARKGEDRFGIDHHEVIKIIDSVFEKRYINPEEIYEDDSDGED